MRNMKTVQVVIVFLVFLVLPAQSFSEVKISLNNGREIIADSCKDSGGKLICETMGGSFEIDKKDIIDIKGITIKHSPSRQVPEEKTWQTDEAGKKGPVKSGGEMPGSEKKPEVQNVKGLTPEQAKRLAEIDSKKAEYTAERENLINERQKLFNDVNNMGVVKTQAQFDDLKKRISDLESRIKSFNEEVKKLNEEEQGIMKGTEKQ